MAVRIYLVMHWRLIVVPVRLRRLVAPALRIGGGLAIVLATFTLTSLVPGPTSNAQSAQATSSAGNLSPGLSGGRQATIGPGLTVHLPKPTQNPIHLAPKGGKQPVRPIVHTHVVPQSQTAPKAPQSPGITPTDLPPLWTPPSRPPARNDLALFQNTVLDSTATAGQTSVDDEPSVASFGNNIFYTGNFYAALSTDGGHTFGYIDPFTAFPTVYSGFCCNQRATYVPGWDMTAWSMMYTPDANNNNIARLAVARGADGLASNAWTYWDFKSTDASLPDGLFLDYPQIAYSSNDLYLTADALNPDGSTFAAVIFRCPLSDLVAGNPNIVCTSFYLSNADTFTPVDGATTTMYWADHVNTSTLQVFSWPENVDWPGVTSKTVEHSAYPNTNNSCPSPDGTNMCGFEKSFNPIHGGWVANGVLGFMWDAAQGSGGLGTFPYPYVHVVELNQGSLALIDQPVIWSISVGWAFGSVTPNGNGGLGVSIASSGGGNYPGSVVMVRDNLNPTSWQPLYARQSTNGPPQNRWGDYLTVRPYGGNGLTWVAASFTQQGTCSDNWAPCTSVQPQILSFGRQSYACLALQSQNMGSQPPLQRKADASLHTIYLPLVLNGGCA